MSNKRTLCCNKRRCVCDNPIGEAQTKTNRTNPIPVAALPDFERLYNLGEVETYEQYLEEYVKGVPGTNGVNGKTYIPNPDTGTYWLDGVDTGIPIGENFSPETDEDVFI